MVSVGFETWVIRILPLAESAFSLLMEGLLLGIVSYKGMLTWAGEGLVETKYIKNSNAIFFIEQKTV